MYQKRKERQEKRSAPSSEVKAFNINWFPGHMAKAKRELIDALKSVDAVAELLDARIPSASRSSLLDGITEGKPKLLIMNRCDLADPQVTSEWESFYSAKGYIVVKCDSKSGNGCRAFLPAARELLAERLARYSEKGQAGRELKIMVVGIPNVGKSSFINRVSGRKAAAAEDRPGVTRTNQWIKLDVGLSLLDTPGILMPKIESERQGYLLAFTGAIRDDIMDIETLACHLMHELASVKPDSLVSRYGIDTEGTGAELLTRAAAKRGFLIRGGEYDTERMAKILFDEYRAGKLGRITLEKVPSEKEA